MSTTAVGRLLIAIGQELGRSESQMEPIIQKVVVDEWYDTIDSLRELNDEQWSRLSLPSRLAELLKQRVHASTSHNESDPPPLTSLGAPKSASESCADNLGTLASAAVSEAKVEIAPPMHDAPPQQAIQEYMRSLRGEVGSDDAAFVDCLRTVLTICRNILSDPTNLKFRQLRANNARFINSVGRWNSAISLLGYLDFHLESPLNEVYKCTTVYISRFTDVEQELTTQLAQVGVTVESPQNTFNPFKSNLINNGEQLGQLKDLMRLEREAEMEQLRQEAQAMKEKQSALSKGVPLEPPRLVSLVTSSTKPAEPVSSIEDDRFVLLSSMKSIVAAGEIAQKFKSRERIELEKSRSKNAYSKTTIRVLFADRKALEIVAGSAESIQSLYAMISNCLSPEAQSSDDWYLHVSPPARKLDRNSKRSLAEEDFLPSATMRMMRNGKQCLSSDILATQYLH